MYVSVPYVWAAPAKYRSLVEEVLITIVLDAAETVKFVAKISQTYVLKVLVRFTVEVPNVRARVKLPVLTKVEQVKVIPFVMNVPFVNVRLPFVLSASNSV